MELLKRIKKNKKGFTLVEIIVVLVILAIIAAFTIPAMLGFVSDANSKAKIAEAREVYVAAQAVATEFTATTGTAVTATELDDVAVFGGAGETAASIQMNTLLGGDVDGATWTVAISAGKVTAITDYSRNGSTPISITPGS